MPQEIIEKHFKQATDRAYWLGIVLGLVVGLVFGFIAWAVF
jgi:hypothetical protein